MQHTVQLVGGPFDGADVEIPDGASLLCEGPPLADGVVARYTQARREGRYRFDGLERVAIRVPLPAGALR